MKQLPDPQQHFNDSVARSNEQYAAWLRRGGVEPNETLMHENQEDAITEARNSYIQEATEVRDHNIHLIIQNSRREMNRIKREGASLRLFTCPPITLLFAFMAWYSFTHASHASITLGIIYTISALTFLGMLFLGKIFDRPLK